MKKLPTVSEIKRTCVPILRRSGVRKSELFGSFARGDAKRSSDVDLLVEFAPRSKDLPVNKVTDRVANKVAGKVWVDAEDWELARMKFWLTEEVALIGGIVGVLRKFELLLERTRLEPNAWLPTTVDFAMAGRELLTNKRVHYSEEAKDFKRVAPAPAVVAPNPVPAGSQ